MRTTALIAVSYQRLSNEEKKRGESASIENQRQLIRDYCERSGILIANEYADDGYTGSNFDRPGFQKMLEHIKTGSVNMVITKDLSRLGRDMTESSHFAERYFPENGIRYIAIEDGFDSSADNMMAPFQFAMNDVYLRDVSKKVKAVLNNKKERGEYACCPPYGYKKAPREKNVLTPDENTAPIVKQIFRMASAGYSTRHIAKELNEQGVIPPLKYKVLYTGEFSDRGAARASDEWGYTTVKRILRNEVYLGHTILGRTKKASLKSNKKIPVSEDDWYITRNTHEPLVTQEEFDLAERYLGENTKANAVNPSFRYSMFGGIAYCATCGSAMCSGGSVYKGEREKYWYLACNNIPSRTSSKCESGARIRYADLVEIVRSELNTLIGLSREEIEAMVSAAIAHANVDKGDVGVDAKKAEKRIADIDKMVARLYSDNIEGKIDDARLDRMVSELQRESAALEQQLKEAKNKKVESVDIKHAYERLFNELEKYTQIDELTRDILHTFIERIEIGPKVLENGLRRATHASTPYSQTIKIYYRFVGELEIPSINSATA